MELIFKYGIPAVFCFLILCWFGISEQTIGFCGAKNKFMKAINENPFGDYEQPRMASSLGVFFTFVGITIGLFMFNPEPDHIQDSVTKLLAGMTTAFATSLVGMGLSFWMKRQQEKLQIERSNEVSGDATIADLLRFLKEDVAARNSMSANILNELQMGNKFVQEELSRSLGQITNSIVGEGDATIIGQIKMTRQDNRDAVNVLKEGNERIIKELQTFAETLAENNSKAFIEALNETMKDFNQKLTEQFGENFKQLNIAVGKLLEWQENYKQIVEDVTALQKETYQAIDGAKVSLQNIDESAKSMSKSADDMGALIATANLFNVQLAKALSDLDALGKEAQEMVPSIYKLTEESKNAIETIAKEGSEKTSNYIISVTDQLKADYDTTLEKTVAAMKESSDQTNDYVVNTTDKLKESYNTTLDNVSNIMKENSEKTNTYIVSTTDQLKESYETALQKATAVMKESSEKTNAYITDTTDQLKANYDTAVSSMNKTLEESTKQVNTYMSNAAVELVDSYDDAIDKITDVMEESTNQTSTYIKESSAQLNQEYKDVFEELAAFATELKKDTEALNKREKDAMDRINDEISKSISTIEEISMRINEASKEQQKAIQKSNSVVEEAIKNAANALHTDGIKITQDVSRNIEKLVKDNNDALRTQTDNINKQLNAELNKSLESLGTTMAQLSKKFTSDYSPLADRLREIVRIAEQVDYNRRGR